MSQLAAIVKSRSVPVSDDSVNLILGWLVGGVVEVALLMMIELMEASSG